MDLILERLSDRKCEDSRPTIRITKSDRKCPGALTDQHKCLVIWTFILLLSSQSKLPVLLSFILFQTCCFDIAANSVFCFLRCKFKYRCHLKPVAHLTFSLLRIKRIFTNMNGCSDIFHLFHVVLSLYDHRGSIFQSQFNCTIVMVQFLSDRNLTADLCSFVLKTCFQLC